MNRETVVEWIENNMYDDIMLADGFDEAFLGVAERAGMEPVATYDRGKCIELLVQRDEMSYDEAREYFDINVFGSWVGELTPMFLTRA